MKTDFNLHKLIERKKEIEKSVTRRIELILMVTRPDPTRPAGRPDPWIALSGGYILGVECEGSGLRLQVP